MTARTRTARGGTVLDPWRASLEAAGFARLVGGRRYRAKAGVIDCANGWAALTAGSCRRRRDPLAGQLGAPGLWRLVGQERSRVRRIFEIPPEIFAAAIGGGAVGGANEPLVEILRWAVATADGGLSAGWVSPARAQIEEWTQEVGMTVRAGSSLRQGVIVHEPERLALVFPLAPPPTTSLSQARRAWLREVVIDAQERWHLVRIGETDAGAIQAEIDLSGAPVALLETLVRTGLDTLRWVVGWLIRSLDFLVDPTVACRALEVLPPRV